MRSVENDIIGIRDFYDLNRYLQNYYPTLESALNQAVTLHHHEDTCELNRESLEFFSGGVFNKTRMIYRFSQNRSCQHFHRLFTRLFDPQRYTHAEALSELEKMEFTKYRFHCINKFKFCMPPIHLKVQHEKITFSHNNEDSLIVNGVAWLKLYEIIKASTEPEDINAAKLILSNNQYFDLFSLAFMKETDVPVVCFYAKALEIQFSDGEYSKLVCKSLLTLSPCHISTKVDVDLPLHSKLYHPKLRFFQFPALNNAVNSTRTQSNSKCVMIPK